MGSESGCSCASELVCPSEERAVKSCRIVLFNIKRNDNFKQQILITGQRSNGHGYVLGC